MEDEACYEGIVMAVRFPAGMAAEEAVRRAKELVPCAVELWEGDGEEYPGPPGTLGLAGLMYCEEGFYDRATRVSPRGEKYGPDDAGVEVEWERP